MTVSIVRLGLDDVAMMRRLNALFGEVFGDLRTYGGCPPSDDYLAGLLSKPHLAALVAVEDGQILGGLVAYEFDKLEQERRELYIYDVAVSEPHRRRGVATALIGRIREIAASRGAWIVYVQADYGDDPAVAFYTKLGRREDVMHFDIDVRPSG